MSRELYQCPQKGDNDHCHHYHLSMSRGQAVLTQSIMVTLIKGRIEQTNPLQVHPHPQLHQHMLSVLQMYRAPLLAHPDHKIHSSHLQQWKLVPLVFYNKDPWLIIFKLGFEMIVVLQHIYELTSRAHLSCILMIMLMHVRSGICSVPVLSTPMVLWFYMLV
jgi:hypothetical protein